MKKESKQAFGMDAFNVLALSTQGVKLPLSLPDGTETEEFIQVYGADRKEFRAALAVSDRERLELAKSEIEDPAEKERIVSEINRNLVAHLVGAWSFPQECNHANVVAFFEQAPQIQAAVDKFAGTRKHFFMMPPKN